MSWRIALGVEGVIFVLLVVLALGLGGCARGQRATLDAYRGEIPVAPSVPTVPETPSGS